MDENSGLNGGDEMDEDEVREDEVGDDSGGSGAGFNIPEAVPEEPRFLARFINRFKEMPNSDRPNFLEFLSFPYRFYYLQ